MRFLSISRSSAAFLLLAVIGARALVAQDPALFQTGSSYDDRILVTTNQLLRPAGKRLELGERAYDMAVNPAGNRIAALTAQGVTLFTVDGVQTGRFRRGAASMAGIAFSPDGLQVAASIFEADGDGITILDVAGTVPAKRITLPAGSAPAGLVFNRAGTSLFVALSRRNQLAEVEIDTGRIRRTVPTGAAPLGVAMVRSGSRIFVTNQGGRLARPGETVSNSAGTNVLVDDRGIAQSGTVSVIEADTFKILAEVETGLHPGGLAIDEASGQVAVANANSDTVSLIDLRTLQITETLSVPAYPAGYKGSSPTDVAFSADGNRLYVSCGGTNSVGIFQRRLSGVRASQLLARGITRYQWSGTAPADWYPVAVAAVPQTDGTDVVFVANSKGAGRNVPASAKAFTISQRSGTLNRMIWPQRLGNENSPNGILNDPFVGATAPDDSPADLSRLGIQHVFLIIKENRTYDQILGDLPTGNGSKELAGFGFPVTPNQHALAQRFVLLDNFYVSGEVSADGHQWLTQAMATDYIERSTASWPRSYPYWGDDPLAFASTGFIWNQAQKQGLSVAIFGEFTVPAVNYHGAWSDYLADAAAPVRQLLTTSVGSFRGLRPFVEPAYPAFNLDVPDQYRARIMIDRLREFEAAGRVPNLVIGQLPTDHTQGTLPGTATPIAMVADNDQAVGKIVEEISNSSYWSSSVIFITEDDAQGGFDHVDGHRSICLVVSPYARRRAVVSTNYNHTSILRTIEELLGMPPMNKFDASALPMRGTFVRIPDFTPYLAQPAQVSMTEMNAPLAALKGKARRDAKASAAMNFAVPDAAPEEKLNKIIWRAVKGTKVPYPKIVGSGKKRDDDD